MAFTIGIPKARGEGENRVAVVPSLLKKYADLGARIVLETQAGTGASFTDAAYEGVTLGSSKEAWQSDLVLVVSPPSAEELAGMSHGASILGLLDPYQNLERFQNLRQRDVHAFAVEKIPRISRAQSMDVLSSQASVGGYKAVLIGAQASPRFFPMLTTAAGTIRPSTVLVIGAGVAGLQALATARRLGAQTEGFDVRPETREQIESLGARFLDLGVDATGEGGYARALTDEERAAQQAALQAHLAKVNVVICTAAVPGRPAPTIITEAMVDDMAAGTVVVDMAAETGGNCVLTRAGETINHHGVIIVGPKNLPAQMPLDASEMLARNYFNFIVPHVQDGKLAWDMDDEIIQGAQISTLKEDV